MAAYREAGPALAAAYTAESWKLKADARLAAAERAIVCAASLEAKEQAENAKAKAARWNSCLARLPITSGTQAMCEIHWNLLRSAFGYTTNLFTI